MKVGDLVRVDLGQRHGELLTQIKQIRIMNDGSLIYVMTNGQWLESSDFTLARPSATNYARV